MCGKSTFASAFREFHNDEVSNTNGHGEATSVQGDSGSVAFSALMDPLFRDPSHNSQHHHDIHAHAHSCLASEFVGSGVGAGVGVCAGVYRAVSSGVFDDEDDACMGGTATDVIHSASNSRIQGF